MMNQGKLFLISILIFTGGCQPNSNLPSIQTTSSTPAATPNSQSISVTPSPLPTRDNSITTTMISNKTTEDTSIVTPSPTPIGPQVVLNGGFDTGIQGWERPYGTLNHTRSDVHTGPGAARLTTNDYSGIVEYRGNAGQCIDLTRFLDLWPIIEGQRYITLEAYLHSDGDITRATLNGIFIDDTYCGTEQVGFFEIPPIEIQGKWVKASGTTTIPDTAKSLHVFVNASGLSDSASILIDDIRAYAVDPAYISD